MKNFEGTVIIGAGPAALAALLANTSNKLLIITGDVRSKVVSNYIHPKIRSISNALGESPGLSDSVRFVHGGNLFATGCVGGLSKYWGQQYVRYLEGDIPFKNYFKNFTEYENICSKLESNFNLAPVLQNPVEFSKEYLKMTPRLIRSNQEIPMCPFSFSTILSSQARERNVELVNMRVQSLERAHNKVRIFLTDGNSILANSVILASGPVGNSFILSNSLDNISYSLIDDHCPTMLYWVGLTRSGLVDNRSNDHSHFNRLTLEKNLGNKVALFSSLYQLSCTNVDFLLSNFGINQNLIKFKTPKLLDFIKPFQSWTRKSVVTYKVGKDVSSVFNDYIPGSDTELISFINMLSKHGIVLFQSKSKSGEGFHYHNLRFEINGRVIHVSHVLNDLFGSLVKCVDASTMEHIAPRPHTLTSMAIAYKMSLLA